MRCGVFSAIVLLTFIATSAYSASKHDHRILEVERNFSKIETLHGKYSMYIAQAGTDLEAEVTFKWPRSTRAEITYPIKMTLIYDAKRSWINVPDYNTAVALDSGTLPKDFFSPRNVSLIMAPHLNFIKLTKRFDYEMLKREKGEGGKVPVFELTRKTPLSKPFVASRVLMWLHKDLPVVTKMELYGPSRTQLGSRLFFSDFAQVSGAWIFQEYRWEMGDGTPVWTVTAGNIRVNVNVKDPSFSYAPPKDCVVLDELPPMGKTEMTNILFLE